MNDPERLIAQLQRPGPSANLDARIGELLLTAERKGLAMTRVRRSSAVVLILVLIYSGYLMTTERQSESESVVADSRTGQQLDPSELKFVSPELDELLVSDSGPARIWGTDQLTWSVIEQ